MTSTRAKTFSARTLFGAALVWFASVTLCGSRMKRLVWLLLAVFCTAFAQVQTAPVSLDTARHCACGGSCDGSCGMPDCAVPPAPIPWVGASESANTARVAKPTRQVVALRRTPAKFFVAFVEPAARPSDLRGADPSAPSANVPLFTAHCSFLL